MAGNTMGKFVSRMTRKLKKGAFLKYLTHKDRYDNTPITMSMF